MITLFITFLMISVFVNLIVLGFKLMWGVGKVLCYIVFFPIIIVGLVLAGLTAVALPVLLIVGLVTLIGAIAA